jgi:hypothetical protein
MPAQKSIVGLGRKQRFAAKFVLARYRRMSLEWIAIGFVTCLFGLIALMPSFDGKWE